MSDQTTEVESGLEGAPTSGRRRLVPWVSALGLYSLIAAIAYWPLSLFGSDRLTFTGDDVAEMVWFLAWPAHALKHLANPLFSAETNAPFGANVIANGALWLLGFICSPITYLFGPVATYTFVARAAFVCSAGAMFFVLRHFVKRWPVALLGGLLYGFSPYMVGQGLDHPFLTFVPLPPLMFWLLYELFEASRFSARRVGIAVGLCSVAQFLISAEVFADVVVLAVFGLLVLVVARRERLVSAWRRYVLAGAWALGVFLVLAGYLAWYTAFGPQHLIGSPEVAELAAFRADLLGTIVPSNLERFSTAALASLGERFASGDYVENGSYLGLPLVLALIVGVIVARRDRLVRYLAVVALAAFVLSLGSPLNVDARVTSIPLPFGLLVRFPFLKDMSAVRYTLFVALFAAVIGARCLDRFLDRGLWRSSLSRLPRHGREALFVLAGIVIIFPLVPRFPYATYPAGTPQYFLDGSAKSIPSGTVVLSYPSPIWPYTQPAIWQAETDMRFKLFGGYVAAPQNYTDVGEGTPILLQPPEMQELFAVAAYGQPPDSLYGPHAPTGGLAPDGSATEKSLRSFAATYNVGVIIADPHLGAEPQLATSYLISAFGPPSSSDDGVDVWYHVRAILARYHQ